jgi:hypothetical protein
VKRDPAGDDTHMTIKGTRSTVQEPASAGSASRRFALGLVRALGGAILFSFPMLMTMERSSSAFRSFSLQFLCSESFVGGLLCRPPKDRVEGRYSRQRWKVERSFAWANRFRRLDRLLEHGQKTYRAFVRVVFIKYYLDLLY